MNGRSRPASACAAALLLSTIAPGCGGGSGDAPPPPPPPPAAPTALEATPDFGRVTLTWNAAAGATSYNVYYGLDGGSARWNGTKATSPTPSLTVAPLVNGMTYYFAVTAVNEGGESDPSSEVSATPPVPVLASMHFGTDAARDQTGVLVGTDYQLSVHGFYTDGHEEDLTGVVSYGSGDETVVTVGSSGLASALSVGTAVVTASHEGVSAHIVLLAADAREAHVTIRAQHPAVVGIPCQLTVQVLHAPGNWQDITSAVSWSSANPSVATVTSSGLVRFIQTAQSVGISARLGQHSWTHNPAVGSGPVTLVRLDGVITMVPGMFVQAYMTLEYRAFGGTVTRDGFHAPAAWSSSNPAVATVSSTGVVRALAEGSTTLTVTYGGISRSATITVGWSNQLLVYGLSPTMLTGTLAVARATPNGSDFDPQLVSWTSSNPNVAWVGQDGEVLAIAPGTAVIEARVGTVRKPTTVTVVDPAAPGAMTTGSVSGRLAHSTGYYRWTEGPPGGSYQDAIVLGYSSLLTAKADGMSIRSGVTFTSSDPSVVSVDDHGVVEGMAEGIATVSATVGDVPVGQRTILVWEPARLSVEYVDAQVETSAVVGGIPTHYYLVGRLPAIAPVNGWNCVDDPTGRKRPTVNVRIGSDDGVVAIDVTRFAEMQSTAGTLASCPQGYTDSQVKPGSITATLDGLTGRADVAALTMTSVAISFEKYEGTALTCSGGCSPHIKAVATLSNGGTRDITRDLDVTWSSSPVGRLLVRQTSLTTIDFVYLSVGGASQTVVVTATHPAGSGTATFTFTIEGGTGGLPPPYTPPPPPPPDGGTGGSGLCHDYTSSVYATVRNWTGAGTFCGSSSECDASLTNNSGFRLKCVLLPYVGATRSPVGALQTEIAAGRTVSGQWGGLWWCAPVNTYKFYCGLPSDPLSCFPN